jgi:hypothetical protein
MFRRLRGVLVVSILAVLLFPAIGVLGDGGRFSPPPASGDWTVTDVTSISGATIVLDGNLTVLPGGVLTLTDCVLVVNCSYPGQFHINVRGGGEFHLRSSNLTALNTSRRFDFTADPLSVLEIWRSEVHGAGSNWTESGATNGVLVRTGNAAISDSLFSENLEALHVRDCSPTVTNCTFINNSAACVAHNSSMVFRDCLVANGSRSGVELRDQTDISITGCNFSGNFRWAVVANQSSVTVARNSFFRNFISVQSEDCRRMVLQDNTFTGDLFTAFWLVRCGSGLLSNDTVQGAYRYGLYELGSNVTAVNTTLNSSGYDIHLEEASSADLVNCTFNRYNLEFIGPDSWINVSWFVNVLVKWWSNESPVPGALVSCADGGGNTSFTAQTDQQGWAMYGVAREYAQSLRTRSTYGPYTVTAQKNGKVTSAVFDINRTTETDILLDDIGPGVRVDFPSSGAYLNLTRVKLKGTAWDNETSVASVECRVDNGSFAPASGTSFWEFTTGILINGRHTVQVRGKDVANNTNTVTVAFTLDTIPPPLTILSPGDGSYTRESNITLLGRSEPNATVTVNGLPAPLDNSTGSFNLTVPLAEGDNVLDVLAADRAGNLAEKVLHVRKDTMIAPFDIFPANGTWTNRTGIDIYGRVEGNTTITILSVDPGTNTTSSLASLNTTYGNFTQRVSLHNGANLIRVEVQDRYGNTATEDITIFQKLLPPAFNITSPPSTEFYTNQRRLVITGTIEPGALLYLNGRPVLVQDGNISKSLTLDLGLNILNLTATDPAGNTVSVLYRVYFDRTPPSLTVISPKRTSSGKPLGVSAGSLMVRGTTEAGALVYVTVNGNPVNGGRPIPVDSFGNFKRSVSLRKGDNSIEVTATDLAGNPTSVTRPVEYSPAPPLLSNEQLAAAVVVIAIVIGFAAVVAWDTKKSTGRWGFRRPVWLKAPETLRERARTIRAFIPKPTFGREDGEDRISPIQAEPRKEGKEPQKAGAAPAPAPAAAAATASPAGPGPPAGPARVGGEFAVSEKPVTTPVASIPGATELPVAEPAAGPAPPAAAPTAAPTASAPGAAPAPARQPAPPTPPPEPPKPKEVDPLAEILGTPTRKV